MDLTNWRSDCVWSCDASDPWPKLTDLPVSNQANQSIPNFGYQRVTVTHVNGQMILEMGALPLSLIGRRINFPGHILNINSFACAAVLLTFTGWSQFVSHGEVFDYKIWSWIDEKELVVRSISPWISIAQTNQHIRYNSQVKKTGLYCN